jgi:hypothetical protein
MARGSKEPTPQDVQKNGQSAISQEDSTLELNQLGTGNRRNVSEPRHNVTSLTDQQVAILCDVGDGRKTKPRHRNLLTGLIQGGFVEIHSESVSKYKLSAKAQQILAERGVGLNES